MSGRHLPDLGPLPHPSLATPDAARGRGAFNRGVYSNSAFDMALDQALLTLDRAEREALLIKATDIAFRDFALTPLHHQFNIEAMTHSIRHIPRIDGHLRAVEVQPQKGE